MVVHSSYYSRSHLLSFEIAAIVKADKFPYITTTVDDPVAKYFYIFISLICVSSRNGYTCKGKNSVKIFLPALSTLRRVDRFKNWTPYTGKQIPLPLPVPNRHPQPPAHETFETRAYKKSNAPDLETVCNLGVS